MCKICRNEDLTGLYTLNCTNCESLTTIPNIKGLKYLNCSSCPSLTTIPNIKGLRYLKCTNCPSLTTIPNIKGIKKIYCWNNPLLTTIHYIKRLELLYCSDCPLLQYIPKCDHLSYNLFLNLPFKNCKYLISKKTDRLYNNIYNLWKSYKLKKYALYLEKEYYSNPRLPYMKYYIENELYDEGESSDSTTQNKLKIGYMNSKHELIWYKF